MNTSELRAGREPSKITWPDESCIEAEPGVTMKVFDSGGMGMWVAVYYAITDESVVVNPRYLAMIEFEG